MKLLIVDDSNMIRRSIERVSSRFPFSEIRTASNGVLALALFESWRPEVVTLDITMPQMDGLAVLDAIKKIDGSTRVLVISALADNATAIEALKRGAEEFICKPFNPDELGSALEEMLP